MPVVLANATLTLAAGLPYVIYGVDAGLRSAAFGPPGWVVLIVVIVGLLHSKWKAAIEIPSALAVGGAAPLGVLMRVGSALEGTPRDRQVH